MSLVQRIFPHPHLTLLLTIVWVLMVNSFTLNSLLFGLFLGIVVPSMTRRFWPDRPKLSSWSAAFEYLFIVLYDIVVANFVVALIVLFKPNAKRHPAWVTIPLDLRTPEAITALAGTITLTPGTVSADLSCEGHFLLVHCLDAPDPDTIRDEIKSRYERRLKEIFE